LLLLFCLGALLGLGGGTLRRCISLRLSLLCLRGLLRRQRLSLCRLSL